MKQPLLGIQELIGLITTWLKLYCGTARHYCRCDYRILINSWWCRCGQRWCRICHIRPTGIFITIVINNNRFVLRH